MVSSKADKPGTAAVGATSWKTRQIAAHPGIVISVICPFACPLLLTTVIALKSTSCITTIGKKERLICLKGASLKEST